MKRGPGGRKRKPRRPQSPLGTLVTVLARRRRVFVVGLLGSLGYTAADVIDVKSDTPNLDVMLAKFSREHWHDEDEVRFIVRGRGLFHIHPREGDGPVIAIEVEAGDLIRVPRETWHWFDLCSDRQIRAIRLFQENVGWTPFYTESGVDQSFEPLCLGLSYIQGSTSGATT